MKTIEETAKYYAEITDPANAEFVMEDFIAGVQFAQRWISIDKELPENGITVLTKDKNGYNGLACRRYDKWDYIKLETITHWRPITLK